MKFVIGVDLGTSSIKTLLVNQMGEVIQKVSKDLKIIQKRAGYFEQDPNEWVNKTIDALFELISNIKEDPKNIVGISFSGQMHSLVLLDKNKSVLRNAILWNDTRNSNECKQIYQTVGKRKMFQITNNTVLEGFTLPKLLWVKNHEPHIFDKIDKFLLPKDYVRYKLTGVLATDYSDAAGTLLLDTTNQTWSKELCDLFDINIDICPPLVSSIANVGKISATIANQVGLSTKTDVFAGGADNACSAIGSGVFKDEQVLCSIGTSGVVLSHGKKNKGSLKEKVHCFNHAILNEFYTMGVTLSAGYSLSWFKNTFTPYKSYDELLSNIPNTTAGADGLLFSPYLAGERTPHMDSFIRGSFIGLQSSHNLNHLTRALIEGITFSLNETFQNFIEQNNSINSVISVGGGSYNNDWLQIQADIFGVKVIKILNEEGPSLGAAMIAAIGSGWFDSIEECSKAFIKQNKEFLPNKENNKIYQELFQIYKRIYQNTKQISRELSKFW